MRPRVVAWDFDGVLNRNIVDGRFVWADDFEADTGQSLRGFTDHVFGADFDLVITGRTDLRDRVADWARQVGYGAGADALLDYWFARDALPDAGMLAMMERLAARGVRQVIATNNEARRVGYIEREMGFAARVEHVFSSGRMGVRKPDAGFFSHVVEVLAVAPGDILLIDDTAANVAAALAQGWQGFHFTEATRNGLAALLEG
ncbi:MAG: HAD family hydrolase [Paracoccaceae bacterium]